jgi:hypothetical protein
MDYKQAYEKTLEDLFFASREIEERYRREEKNLIILDTLRSVISSFDSSIDRLQGERKTNALNTLKKLYMVFIGIGGVYLDELSARKKSYQVQKENIELVKIIDELKKEIETLKKIDEL